MTPDAHTLTARLDLERPAMLAAVLLLFVVVSAAVGPLLPSAGPTMHTATSVGYVAVASALVYFRLRYPDILPLSVAFFFAWFIFACAVDHALAEYFEHDHWFASMMATHEALATWATILYLGYAARPALQAVRQLLEEARTFRAFWLRMTGGTACTARVEGKATGRFLTVSPEFCTLLERSEAFLLAVNFLDLINEEDLPMTRDAVGRLEAGERIVNFLNRYRMPAGVWKWIYWESWSDVDAEGVRTYYFTARDGTQDVEGNATRSERDALWNSSIPLVRVDPSNAMIPADANEAYCRLLGQPRDVVLGNPYTAFVPRLTDRQRARDAAASRTDEDDNLVEFAQVFERGGAFDPEAEGELINVLFEKIHAGADSMEIWSVRDVTAQRAEVVRLEDEAREAAEEAEAARSRARTVTDAALNQRRILERFEQEQPDEDDDSPRADA